MSELSRDALIALCRRGVVPVDQWRDRDSAGAQKQLGEALALLEAGCDFRQASHAEPTTSTIWIMITYPGFNAFEYGRDDIANHDDDLFYIPTLDRLERAAGGDWY